MTSLRLAADHLSARAIGPWLQDSLDAIESAQRDRVGELELAIHEVAINIVDHAFSDDDGTNHYTICLDDDSQSGVIRVQFRDAGAPFRDAPTPDLNEPQVRGYGLFIAEQLTSELTYERVKDTNVWTLTFAPTATSKAPNQETP